MDLYRQKIDKLQKELVVEKEKAYNMMKLKESRVIGGDFMKGSSANFMDEDLKRENENLIEQKNYLNKKVETL